MPITETGGILTSANSGAINVGERVLVDYKDALGDYKATELPVIKMFATTMSTDTGGDIDLSFALPSMKMESIDEGSTPKYQHTKMRSERVGVREWGIAVGVTRRMIEDSRFNEVELALNEARKAVDRHITDHFVKCVYSIADSTYGTGISGATTIDAATGDTESAITTFATNPHGGWLGDGSTINSGGRAYSYANSSDTNLVKTHYLKALGGATDGMISLIDILTAMERISQHGYNPDTLLISPLHYHSLLKLADFTSGYVVGSGASVVGSATNPRDLENTFVEGTNQTATIGSIYGLKVIVNAWNPTDRFLVFDASVKPVAYVERRGLTVEEANPGFGIVGSYLSMRYGLKIVNGLAGAVSVNQA
jgi:hypothetical protein